MESNGFPGRINVSQATADELIKAGKRHWLVQREDKIVAKGKGELTAYFIQISDSENRTCVSSEFENRSGMASESSRNSYALAQSTPTRPEDGMYSV